jgi:hypothetical protein
MKANNHLFALLLFLIPIIPFAQNKPVPRKAPTPGKGMLTITFKNTFNGIPIILNDSIYTNVFGENFSISKLKYYVSDICLFSATQKNVRIRKYFLINQEIDSSLSCSFPLQENMYDSISFLFGVDSTRNVSGAQTGALDPMNDMFWTWNSGYIMQKLEGYSASSNATNNKMEYHLGGFSGQNSVLKNVCFPFTAEKKLVIKAGKKSSIHIEADFAKFWKKGEQFNISKTPVCTTPGKLAKELSGNFLKLFSNPIVE